MTMTCRQLGCTLARSSLSAALLLTLGACKGQASAPADTTADATPTKGSTSVTEAGGPPNESALPAASVQAFVNPAHLPVYQGPTGSIEGTVTVTGDPSPDTKNREYSKCPQGETA